MFQLNLGLHKEFHVTETTRMEFRMEGFNFLNTRNFGNPNGNRSSGAFGTIASTQPAREIQLALRLAF